MAQYFAALTLAPKPFEETGQVYKVTQTVVVGDDIPTADGPLKDNPKHADGEAWCVNWFKGGTWKQAFKNGLRKQFPSFGHTYDYAKDKFLAPQPYASWSLDADDNWVAPVPYPTTDSYVDGGGKTQPYGIFWDDENSMWKALDSEVPNALFEWNPSTLEWETPAV